MVGPVEVQGTGDWIFPIGNGTTYLPVEISNVTATNTSATLTLHELNSGEVLTGEVDIAKLSSKALLGTSAWWGKFQSEHGYIALK
ncbi:MAG: hypothetical protein IPK96_06515 [Flammeovirgaceae bacterium]|nr:hypothetical protein [Flammeovirgaceae bacterium]